MPCIPTHPTACKRNQEKGAIGKLRLRTARDGSGHEHDLQDITEPDQPGLRYITSGGGSKTRWETGSGKNKKNFFSIAPGFVVIGLSQAKAKVQFWFMDGTMAYEYTTDANQ